MASKTEVVEVTPEDEEFIIESILDHRLIRVDTLLCVSSRALLIRSLVEPATVLHQMEGVPALGQYLAKRGGRCGLVHESNRAILGAAA